MLRTGLIALCLAATCALPAAAQTRAPEGNELESILRRLGQIERQIGAVNREITRQRDVVQDLREGDAPAFDGQDSLAIGASTGPGLAAFQMRVTQMENSIRELTGQMERQNFRARQFGERLDRLVSDIDLRLRRIEARLGGATEETAQAPLPPNAVRRAGQSGQSGQSEQQRDAGESDTGPQPGAAGFIARVPESEFRTRDSRAPGQGRLAQPAPLEQERWSQGGTTGMGGTAGAIEGIENPGQTAEQQAMLMGQGLDGATPEEQYDFAFGLLRARDFDQAERAFASFLAANKEHSLASNARYWLAETYFVRGQMEQAAVEFAEGYQAYPDGAKAPDNLLKLGITLAELGRNDDACLTYAQLAEAFPDAPGQIRRRAEREVQRLNCE